MSGRRRTARLVVLGGGLVSVALYAWTFLRLLPGPGGTLGHDWSYFLPQLLAGAYWMSQNGWAEVPWFTPAWLGGVPFHPNPQNLFFSLPQQLCRVTDPLTAVRITTVLCAAVGHSGTYLLLRRSFGLRRPAAALGAVLFGWNGYLASRLLIGHLVYHTFALVPWVALFVLGRGDRPARWWRDVRAGVGAGISVALMIHACDLHGIPVAALAVLALASIRHAAGATSLAWVRRAAVATVASLALSASKLVAMATFLGQFPRDGYALPGAASVGDALRLAGATLFARAPTALGADVLVNTPWRIDRHELEYGVSPVALGFLLAGVVYLVRSRPSLRVAPLLGVVAIALVPVAVNVHAPAWEAALKSVPLLGSGSNLLRTMSLLIPIACVLAALAMDRLRVPSVVRTTVVAMGIAGVVLWNATDDRTYYAQQPYTGDRVVRAWDRVARTGEVPAIDRVTRPVDDQGRAVVSAERNEGFIGGASPLEAFEPIFGYRLEWLPAGDLVVGPALPQAGAPNLRDPSRFVWPELNGGPPGSVFPPDRRAAAETFATWRPFAFERSGVQRLADVVNVLALAGLVVVGLVSVAVTARRRFRAVS